MNQKDFEKELDSQLHSHSLDIQFLIKWYENTLKQLDALSEQRRGITHPRHRGDSRESDFRTILQGILPEVFRITRGFAVNSKSTQSREQDCLIYNGGTGVRLMSSKSLSYIPIESVLASVEIKSNLTLGELRKAVINAVSLKKLLIDLHDDKEKEDYDDHICYAIFAYKSSGTLSRIATQLTELSKDVPDHLSVNMIFVLGKGLIVPRSQADGDTIGLGYPSMLKPKFGYGFLEAMGTKSIPKSKAVPFLVFVMALADQCVQHSMRSRKEFKQYWEYALHPIQYQMWVEKIIKEREQEKGKVQSPISPSGETPD